MNTRFIIPLALATVLPCAAVAQSGGGTSGSGQQSSQGAGQAGGGSNQQSSADKLASIGKVKQDLQNAGFTDVQIVAEAFVVQAKTKDGDPVVMTMGPHGFTAFEAVGSGGNTGSTNNGGQKSK